MDNKIYIFALAAHGEGISGGDRIFIEFARYWSQESPVTIFLWEEGYGMLKRQQMVSEQGKVQNEKLKIKISRMKLWSNLGFIINYFARIVEGIRLGLMMKLENSKDTIVYSASEFWMDSLPALILKLRYPKIKWAAAWYQTAPNPIKGFAEGSREERYRMSSFLYWMVQLPIKPLIKRLADFVLVNNDEEKKQFRRAVVVLGAVDLERIKIWKSQFEKLPIIYDAVFQGRFHPQKGVLELISIWKKVTEKRPEAKLIMIGDGPLMERVKEKVERAKLENNIKLTGYMFDGEEKYKIFAQSKVVVHPAFFDSGGMASAEAMAFGLPCIGFDLRSYKYYYPEGMEKVEEGNIESFAKAVLGLLGNNNLYRKISREAVHFINHKWSWEYRARQILTAVLE